MSEERNERNAIFGNPPAAAPRADIRASMGVDIPTETVPLPSLGKVYQSGSPLHQVETVEIRPMTTREEDILTNRALIKTGKVVTALIKSCLADSAISVPEMIAGDRNALMMAIRITGYGPEYTGELQCPECDIKFQHEFNLGELPIKNLDIEPVNPGTNEFEFVLPLTKRRVTFKYLNGKDEEDMMARQENLKKKNMMGQENLITTKLFYSILSVEGLNDKSQISAFVNSMPARDSLALRKYMDSHEPGVEMKQDSQCPSCGHTEEVSVPMGVAFFWPNAAR